MSSWPPLKSWGEESRANTGWKEAMWSLQRHLCGAHYAARAPSRQEDVPTPLGTGNESYHAQTAHWTGRQEAAHQEESSEAAGGSSRASMPRSTMDCSAHCRDEKCHHAAHAFQHGARPQTDRGHNCSPQQAQQRTILTAAPDPQFRDSHPANAAASPGTDALPRKPRQQHISKSAHGRHRHSAEPPQVAVTISSSVLRAVMRDLAKGLAGIRELRRTAEKAGLCPDQPRSPLCDRPVSPRDQHPGTQIPAREDSHPGQLPTSRHNSAQQKAGLQGSQHSAGSRGPGTAGHGSQKAGQGQGAGPVGQEKGSYLPHAQPTGHPMVRWRTSLRSTEPLCCTHVPKAQQAPKTHSARGPNAPAFQKIKSTIPACSDKPSTEASQQSARPERCGALPSGCRTAEMSSGHSAAVLHARLCTDTAGNRQQGFHPDHKQTSASLLATDLKAEQQGLTTSPSAQPCQQPLRQQYLPVYSVFDEKASTADGAKDLLCADLVWQSTHKAADAPEVVVDAAQQRQVGNNESLHASLASTHANEADKVQHPHVDNDCSLAQSEYAGSEAPGIHEDNLRAALQKFAMRVA